MEDVSSSHPEHLVLLVSKLKEVFDMCDEDEDGFIRVEHFVHLGRQFGQTDEEVKLPFPPLPAHSSYYLQAGIGSVPLCHQG